jgi:uncharacterized spore protein YtfJ
MAVDAQERSELANELLGRIGQALGQRAQAGTVFGEAVEREGITVIPVAKARFGFGGGAGGAGVRAGKDEGSGGGGGGGIAVTPIGYIEVRDHNSEFKRIKTQMDVLAFAAAASIAAIALRGLLR